MEIFGLTWIHAIRATKPMHELYFIRLCFMVLLIILSPARGQALA